MATSFLKTPRLQKSGLPYPTVSQWKLGTNLNPIRVPHPLSDIATGWGDEEPPEVEPDPDDPEAEPSPAPTPSGGGGGGGGGGTDSLLGDLEDLFQPDKFSRSWNYTGLPVESRDALVESIIPELINKAMGLSGEIDQFESDSLSSITSRYGEGKEEYQSNIQDAKGEIDEYTKLASRSYEIQGRQALEGAMTDILNDLANRNILHSSIAGDAIAKASSEIIETYATKGFEAAMKAAELRLELSAEEAETLLDLVISQSQAEQGVRSEAMGQRAGLPVTLAAIANLGRYSAGGSENPLEPYQLLANFIAAY
jgi:hypothetical protein